MSVYTPRNLLFSDDLIESLHGRDEEFTTIDSKIITGSRAEHTHLKDSGYDHLYIVGPGHVYESENGTEGSYLFYKQTEYAGYYKIIDADSRLRFPKILHNQLDLIKQSLICVGKPWTEYVIEAENNNKNKIDTIDDKECTSDEVIALPLHTWPKDVWDNFNKTKIKWNTTLREQLKDEKLYFVPKNHPKSRTKEQEWRLSFSMVEKKIMLTIPETYRKAYIWSKWLKRHWLNDSIQSFYLKTVLLFMLDENGPIADGNPYSLLREMFMCLYKRLELGTLENYFIPEMNLLEALSIEKKGAILEQVKGCLDEDEFKMIVDKQLSKFVRAKVEQNNLIYNPPIDKNPMNRNADMQKIQKLFERYRFSEKYEVFSVDKTIACCVQEDHREDPKYALAVSYFRFCVLVYKAAYDVRESMFNGLLDSKCAFWKKHLNTFYSILRATANRVTFPDGFLKLPDQCVDYANEIRQFFMKHPIYLYFHYAIIPSYYPFMLTVPHLKSMHEKVEKYISEQTPGDQELDEEGWKNLIEKLKIIPRNEVIESNDEEFDLIYRTIAPIFSEEKSFDMILFLSFKCLPSILEDTNLTLTPRSIVADFLKDGTKSLKTNFTEIRNCLNVFDSI